MFGKALNILVTIAVCGFLAVFVAAGFYIILYLLFLLAMIPVSIIAGDGVAHKITNFADNGLSFKIVYAIVFISMVMEDPTAQGTKNFLKRWWHRSIKWIRSPK